MADVKIIAFDIEVTTTTDAQRVKAIAEAERQIAELLSDGYHIAGTGATSTMGFVVLQRDESEPVAGVHSRSAGSSAV